MVVPLKRVTLSGRLGEKNEGDDWKRIFAKGLIYMGFDIAMMLMLSIVVFYFFVKKVVAPHEQSFRCNDDTIRYPFYPNTVSLKHLLAVSLGLPYLIILLVEAQLFAQSKGENRLAKFFTTSTIVYMKYLVMYALATFAMEFLKCYFGRLRPHFIAACQPDWSRMDCTTNPLAIIHASDTFCLNVDHQRVRTARTSFPSGHTAAAVMSWLFICLYLTRMARVSCLRSLHVTRKFILPFFSIWTVFCAISRVTDRWHHPSDVMGGIGLAIVVVYPMFGASFMDDAKVYGPRKIEKVQEKEKSIEKGQEKEKSIEKEQEKLKST